MNYFALSYFIFRTLILRQIENDVKHILLHTDLKLDGEVEITWIQKS